MHVLRCFEDENVVHVDGSVDPVRDKEIIDTELQLKDLESVEKRLEKHRKATKATTRGNARCRNYGGPQGASRGRQEPPGVF